MMGGTVDPVVNGGGGVEMLCFAQQLHYYYITPTPNEYSSKTYHKIFIITSLIVWPLTSLKNLTVILIMNWITNQCVPPTTGEKQ